MQDSPLLLKFLRGIILPALLLFGVPLGLTLADDVTLLPKTLAFILSILVIEYFSIPVGLSLGLSPPVVLVSVVAGGTGMFLATVEALEALRKVGWLSRMVSGVQRRASKSRLLRKYGIYGLAPSVVYLSVKGCAAVVWLMGWSKWRALALTIASFTVISAIVLLSTLGLLKELRALLGS